MEVLKGTVVNQIWNFLNGRSFEIWHFIFNDSELEIAIIKFLTIDKFKTNIFRLGIY